LELDQDVLKSDLSKQQRATNGLNYGALSNKMDVMQESYNALEKNSNEALQINMSKIVICYRN
jgi:chemotaxis protein MotB